MSAIKRILFPSRERSAASRDEVLRKRREFSRISDQFRRDGGYAVIARTPHEIHEHVISDMDSGRSACVVLEDGRPLPLPHALHDDIRTTGEGRYSHWGDSIYFSSSDGTDPNTNGREYAIDPRDGSGPISLHPDLSGIRFVTPEEIPRRFLRRMPIANRWCQGEGIEIGGTAYNTIAGLNVRNACRRLDWAYIEESAERSGGCVRQIEIMAEGDDLPLADESADFVFSSHVLEHFPDPIRALKEWDRILRLGGIMFAIVPHKDRTFDREKPRTPLEEQFERYGRVRRGPQEPDQHYSIWITQDVVDLVHAMTQRGLVQWDVVDVEDVDSNVGNGFTIVCRKRARTTPA